MKTEILTSLFGHEVKESDLPEVSITGNKSHGLVSDLAITAVVSAVQATQRFCGDVYGQVPSASVSKNLVDRWCKSSFKPDNWQLPPVWNEYSHDYRTQDGWVRIHCNAEHHRKSALEVLEGADTFDTAKENALKWQAAELVDAIHHAGGCASLLQTTAQWMAQPQAQAVRKEPVIAWSEGERIASIWQPQSMTRPLEGLRVLDLTRIIAGPVSTRYLASLGADVLRIDPPNWNEGANEVDMTLGKTCAELDLTKDADRATFEHLVESAHILIYGYRKDALANLDYSLGQLTELNPSLLSVGLTAYGWTGPWQNRRGFDSLVQRSTGLAFAQAGKVVELPYQVLDHSTGYLMAAAAMEALRLQLSNQRVSHAKLSLARQAHLLLGSMQKALVDEVELDEKVPEYQSGTYEETVWGGVWRSPLPYNIEGVSSGWAVKAHPLRSDIPEWR